jgi:hypothetical protein
MRARKGVCNSQRADSIWLIDYSDRPMRLLPNETDLVGKWQLVNNAIEANSTCRRIERLIRGQLT